MQLSDLYGNTINIVSQKEYVTPTMSYIAVVTDCNRYLLFRTLEENEKKIDFVESIYCTKDTEKDISWILLAELKNKETLDRISYHYQHIVTDAMRNWGLTSM